MTGVPVPDSSTSRPTIEIPLVDAAAQKLVKNDLAQQPTTKRAREGALYENISQ